MEANEILNESVENLANNSFDNSLIVDNKIVFIINNKLFRVRMPNQGIQALAEHKRNLIQLEYMNQEGCITKNQIIKQLKDNNVVDIDKLEETRNDLTKELKKFWFLLATKDSAEKTKIADYSDKIVKIQQSLQSLAIDISTYLSPSLESRLEKFYLEQITCLCSEQKIGEEWKPIWKDLEEFNNAETLLTNKCISNMTWLLLNRR